MFTDMFQTGCPVSSGTQVEVPWRDQRRGQT